MRKNNYKSRLFPLGFRFENKIKLPCCWKYSLDPWCIGHLDFWGNCLIVKYEFMRWCGVYYVQYSYPWMTNLHKAKPSQKHLWDYLPVRVKGAKMSSQSKDDFVTARELRRDRERKKMSQQKGSWNQPNADRVREDKQKIKEVEEVIISPQTVAPTQRIKAAFCCGTALTHAKKSCKRCNLRGDERD